jgi:hypothetical protein
MQNLKIKDKVAVPIDDNDNWQGGIIISMSPDKELSYVELMQGSKKGYYAVKTSTLRLLKGAENEQYKK